MNKGSVAASVGSNLRVRLFWKLQGWRLRNTVAQENSRSVTLFSNFIALNHRGNADAVCDLAESLTAHAPDMLPVTAKQMKARLARELGPKSCVAVLGAEKGSAGGFAWARVSAASEALEHCRQNPGLAGVDEAAWSVLTGKLGVDPALVLYDLGLGTQYRRGFSPIKQLLKPLLELGLSHGVRRAFWWAPAGSPAAQLALAFGARTLLQGQHTTFFMLDDITNITRVMTALPASAISALLSRTAGPRQLREPARHSAPLRQPVSDEGGLVRLALDSSAAGTAAPTQAAALQGLVASNDVDGIEVVEEIEIFSRPQAAAASRSMADAPRVETAGMEVVELSDDDLFDAVAPLRSSAAQNGVLADLPRRLSALFPHRAV